MYRAYTCLPSIEVLYNLIELSYIAFSIVQYRVNFDLSTSQAFIMQKLFTKTVYIRSDNQFEQFAKLKIGQWVTGLSLMGKSGLYRGQFMGFDSDSKPIINLRLDNAKRVIDWKEQFASNKPLRQFAKIKG